MAVGADADMAAGGDCGLDSGHGDFGKYCAWDDLHDAVVAAGFVAALGEESCDAAAQHLAVNLAADGAQPLPQDEGADVLAEEQAEVEAEDAEDDVALGESEEARALREGEEEAAGEAQEEVLRAGQ